MAFSCSVVQSITTGALMGEKFCLLGRRVCECIADSITSDGGVNSFPGFSFLVLPPR